MSHLAGADESSMIVLAEMDLFYYLFLDTLQIEMRFPLDKQFP